MARKTINIGTLGNDGTGDSIRDAFRSVNENFRELYGSLGLGERLQFTGLSDTPDSYEGFSNAVVTVDQENPAEKLRFRNLVAGSGVTIDTETNSNQIIITSEFNSISGDPNPALGGDLSAFFGEQRRILDLGTTQNPLIPEFEHEAVNKAYADRKVALSGTDSINSSTGLPDSRFGRMSGPLILSRDPVEEDDDRFDGLIAATKRYVDNSGFSSSINLYVAKSGADERPGLDPSAQGRALAYAFKTIGAAMRRAEELIDDAPVELGPYQKLLTIAGSDDVCTLTDIVAAPDSGDGFEGQIRLAADTVRLRSAGTNYYPGDILELDGGVGSPTSIQVTSTLATPGPIESFRVISRGVYSELPGSNNIETQIVTSGAPEGFESFGQLATFDVLYRVADVVVVDSGNNYGLVSVRIIGGGGIGAFGVANVVGGQIVSITVNDPGSGFDSFPTLEVNLPRFLINTNGQRTNFSGSFDGQGNLINARTQDIRPGLFLRGERSGALAQILEHTGQLIGNDEVFDVDIRRGAFEIGEPIAYGDVSKEIQISVIVESGIYEEHYPIKIPQNVAILGDEFRRVLIRPIKNTVSASPWALDRFRRDITLGRQDREGAEFNPENGQWQSTGEIDGDLLPIADRLYGYHYLSDSGLPVYNNPENIVDNAGNYRTASTLLTLNKTFLQDEIGAWIDQQVRDALETGDTESIWYLFEYNDALCRRDVGLIIDAISYDLKLGVYKNTIAAGLRYFESPSAQRVITSISASPDGQLEQHVASLNRLNQLIQLVLKNIPISEKLDPSSVQIIDQGLVTEMGVVGESFSIDSISTSDPVTIILSSSANTLQTGDKIIVAEVQGTVELNSNEYFIEKIDDITIDLYLDAERNIPVDGSEFETHIAGTGKVFEPQGVIGELITALIDVVQADPEDSSSVINFPKNNDELDVFLCNDATILRRVTAQGHGGFMMVLDPVGQILAKSPYAQECASFSRSTNQQTFAGGMYVDGFTGNLQFKFLEYVTDPLTGTPVPNRIRVGGLDRFPQLPASIIIDGEIFRINYVRNFVYNPQGSTGDLELSVNTPFDQVPGPFPCDITPGDPAVITANDHGLQPNATVVFTSTDQLPGGLEADVEYYVLAEGLTNNQFIVTKFFGSNLPVEVTDAGSGDFEYERIYEILMPGNRSMLANDFTQINDMGYGLVTNNGGLLEAVSVFTYYCFVSYYSVNGGQIRSISGSSAHGVYALVAEGFDPLEVPTPTGLFFEKSQRVICVNDGGIYANQQGGLTIFITGWDYLPLPNSEIEINHDGIIVRYPVNSAQRDEIIPGIARLTLASDFTGTFDGLADAVPDGTALTARMSSEVILTGDIVDVATRPSTGLRLFEQPDRIYRVLQFSAYEDSEAPFEIEIEAGNPGIFAAVSTIVNIDSSNICTTLKNHRLKPGDKFVPLITAAGLDADVTYYVKTVPQYDQFTLSASPGGDELVLDLGDVNIQGKKTHRFRENFLIKFSTDDSEPSHQLPEPLNSETNYFVISDGLTDLEFQISEVRNGSPIAITSAGIGEFFYSIQGLAQTLLRENYDYVTLSVFQPGEFASDYTPQVVDITLGNPTTFSLNNHGLVAGDVVKFVPSVDGGTPIGLPPIRNYYVIGDGLTANEFRVSTGPTGSSVVTSGDVVGDIIVGKVTGRAGDSDFAVVPIGEVDEQRVLNTVAFIQGEPYVIVDYKNPAMLAEQESISVPYARVTLDRPLQDSIINFDGNYSLRSAISPDSLGSQGTLTIRIALVRVTGHDLLDIGTGSYSDTNYPNEIFGPPVNPRSASNETQERDVGRVFYATTDQFGNFRVGPFFSVDQGTGQVTFAASIALSNLDGLGFKRGVPIAEFSIDSSFVRNAVDSVPTENAARGYIERRLGITHGGSPVQEPNLIPPFTGGFMSLDGQLPMKGNLNLDNNRIIAVEDPLNNQDAVNKQWTKLENLQDGTLTSTADADLLMLTGSGGEFVNVSNNNDTITNTSSTISGGSDVTITRSGNIHTVKLVGGEGTNNPITDYHVNDNADIQQSKLLMQLADTRVSAPSGSAQDKQATAGLASFNEVEFSSTDGFIEIKTATSTTNGVAPAKLQWIAGQNALANAGTSPGAVSAVSFSSLVDLGGSIKKNQYTAIGFLRRTSAVSSELDANYSVVDMSSTLTYSAADNNKLIVRDSTGSFGANLARLNTLEINAGQSNRVALQATATGTGGNLRLFGWNGVGGITQGGGTQVSDRITTYANDEHRFRNSANNADAFVRVGTLRTTAITTGASGTAGTITGNWSLTEGSRLQATYSADVAEYYEGDIDYPVGTVLVFGGDKEVTISRHQADSRVAGVVSDNAAFVMYDACPGHKNLIALQGRVPCRVVGKIAKGDLLVTSNIKGVAVSAGTTAAAGTIIGKALSEYNSDHIGNIEISVGRT